MSWLSDTLGSVAGSVLGSAVQNHYNSANAAQANEIGRASCRERV